jgi:hypothetical protein
MLRRISLRSIERENFNLPEALRNGGLRPFRMTYFYPVAARAPIASAKMIDPPAEPNLCAVLPQG